MLLKFSEANVLKPDSSPDSELENVNVIHQLNDPFDDERRHTTRTKVANAFKHFESERITSTDAMILK